MNFTDELIAQLTEQDVDSDSFDPSQSIYQEFGIEEEAFDRLLAKLMPLITVAESPLTKTWYKGFAKDGLWLYKEQI